MIQDDCRQPVTVVPNPLPEDLVAQNRSGVRGTSDPNQPILAMVVNGWARLKNADTAIRAFQLLRKRIGGATLHIYGADFGSGQRAERWARRRNMAEGIVFHGPTPHTGVLSGLRDSDLLIHPSLLEGCPMAVVEAMAFGLPVVGGESSGGVAWVIGGGGVLTDVKSAEQMSESIYRILSDRDLYERCARSAIQRAREVFSVSTVVAAYELLYLQAASRMHG
jgi:glycosyltransferase involved in cell wall biosynthesis